MLKYVSRSIDKLPPCIRPYIESIALAKTDDYVKIVRHNGYEVWVWSIDMSVDICRLPNLSF